MKFFFSIAFFFLNFSLLGDSIINFKIKNNFENITSISLGLPINEIANFLFPTEFKLIEDSISVTISNNSTIDVSFELEKIPYFTIIWLKPNDTISLEFDCKLNSFKCTSNHCQCLNEILNLYKKYEMILYDHFLYGRKDITDDEVLKSFLTKSKEVSDQIPHYCLDNSVNFMKQIHFRLLSGLRNEYYKTSRFKTLFNKIDSLYNLGNNVHHSIIYFDYVMMKYQLSDQRGDFILASKIFEKHRFLFNIEDPDELSYILQYFFYMAVKINLLQSFGDNPISAYHDILPFIKNSKINLSKELSHIFDFASFGK